MQGELAIEKCETTVMENGQDLSCIGEERSMEERAPSASLDWEKVCLSVSWITHQFHFSVFSNATLQDYAFM